MVSTAFLAHKMMLGLLFFLVASSVQALAQRFSSDGQVIFTVSIVPSPSPNANAFKSNCGLTTPFLRALQELEIALLEIFHIPSIAPVCTSKCPHGFFFLIQKMPLL